MRAGSRYASPIFVEDDGAVKALQRHQLGPGLEDRSHREEFIEALIHNYPAVIPMADIEPALTPLVSVCRQLPTAAGIIDNLWLTPDGGLILGECKLVRNPQARQEVVAQALDYGRALASWHYEDLEAAVRKALKVSDVTLWSFVSQTSELDEAQFVDAVQRRLRSGRIMILIIGDGIQEGVEALTSALQLHAGLHAGLALVELSIWTGLAGGILVVPRVPLRTEVIERGVVVFDSAGALRIDPPPSTAPAGAAFPKPVSLSESEFYEQLEDRCPGTSDPLKFFVDTLDEPGVVPEFRKSLILRWRVNEDEVGSLGYVDRWGTAYVGDALSVANRLGLRSAGLEYLEEIAKGVGGQVKLREKNNPTVLGADGREVKIDALLAASDDWKRAIKRFVARASTLRSPGERDSG